MIKLTKIQVYHNNLELINKEICDIEFRSRNDLKDFRKEKLNKYSKKHGIKKDKLMILFEYKEDSL